MLSVCSNRSRWHRISVRRQFFVCQLFYFKNGASWHQLFTNFVWKFTKHLDFPTYCPKFICISAQMICHSTEYALWLWTLPTFLQLTHHSMRCITCKHLILWEFSAFKWRLSRSKVLKVRWGRFGIQKERTNEWNTPKSQIEMF